MSAIMIPALLLAVIALGHAPGVVLGLSFLELARTARHGQPSTGPCHRAGLVKVVCP